MILYLAAMACSQKKTVNPNIILPGAPGNAGEAPAVMTDSRGNSGSDLVFLGSEVVRVPAGTDLFVMLVDAVDASQSSAGDSFRAILGQPLMSGTAMIAPAGTPLTGQVTDVSRESDLEAPSVSLSLLEIMVNSRWFSLQTSLLQVRGDHPPARPAPEAAGETETQGAAPGRPRTLHVPGGFARVVPNQPMNFYLLRDAWLEVSGTVKSIR